MLFDLLFSVSIITIYTKQSSKSIWKVEKVIIWLTFNPELALITGFRTILPCLHQVNMTWACDPIEKPALGQRSKNTSPRWVVDLSPRYGHVILVSRYLVFDRCQLIITWTSKIKEVHGNLRLRVSVNLLFGGWPPSCATPSSPSPPSCVRAHEQYR